MATKKAEVQPEEEAKPRIRIKIKAYDHKVIDRSARQIVETAERIGRGNRGSGAFADPDQKVYREQINLCPQGCARSV